MMSTFLCTWYVADQNGQPQTYFDKQAGVHKIKRFKQAYRDYTRNGALRQLRTEYGDQVNLIKVNCEKVY